MATYIYHKPQPRKKKKKKKKKSIYPLQLRKGGFLFKAILHILYESYRIVKSYELYDT